MFLSNVTSAVPWHGSTGPRSNRPANEQHPVGLQSWLLDADADRISTNQRVILSSLGIRVHLEIPLIVGLPKKGLMNPFNIQCSMLDCLDPMLKQLARVLSRIYSGSIISITCRLIRLL
jgi:hypothetical protein